MAKSTYSARYVLGILDSGQYTTSSGALVSIREAQAHAEEGTVLYTPERLATLTERNPRPPERAPVVEVRDATTQQAAQSLAAGGEVALLNFASARNPGGGFLGGAKAQEEELCRCSGLYRALLTQPEYYEAHRKDRSLLYSDRIIYSPGVPFFRLDGQAEFLEAPFLCAVITAPAPNAGAIRRNAPEDAAAIESTFARRWRNVLAVAEDGGHRVLVLGAWGCGAFRNDAVVVAKSAHDAIYASGLGASFERIVFAIPGFGQRSRGNLRKFRAVFQSLMPS